MSADGNKPAIDVIITGFPANLRTLQTLPGESRLHAVIRTFPREWQNFLQRMTREQALPPDIRDRLLTGDTAGSDKWSAHVQDFFNRRTPSHGRTWECLANLRADVRKPGLELFAAFTLGQIIAPRQKDPDVGKNQTAEALAARYAITIVWIDTADTDRSPLRPQILAAVKSEFAWLVPGGTFFSPATTTLGLSNLVGQFQKNPDFGLFSDNKYTLFARTTTLRTILETENPLPTDAREMAKATFRHGYKCSAADMPLVELEPIYGGEPGPSDAVVRAIRHAGRNRTWWQKLFWLR